MASGFVCGAWVTADARSEWAAGPPPDWCWRLRGHSEGREGRRICTLGNEIRGWRIGDDHSRKLAVRFGWVECAQNAESKAQAHPLRTGSGDQSSRNGNEKVGGVLLLNKIPKNACGPMRNHFSIIYPPDRGAKEFTCLPRNWNVHGIKLQRRLQIFKPRVLEEVQALVPGKGRGNYA